MAANIFPQNVIALIWDFDKTLTPAYMQEPLFAHYGVDGAQFWNEVDHLPEFHRKHGLERVSRDTLYLNHMLTYVRHGRFKGLNNAKLRELGGEIGFFEGIPAFFQAIRDRVAANPTFKAFRVEVEHYVISSGLIQMILGSRIAPHADGVWGCDFVETVPPPGYLGGTQQALIEEHNRITDIGYVIDNTTKTRAVFEINKGVNKDTSIDVNAKVAPEDRRVPFQHMIYVADGPSDIPVFSVVNQNGGRTYAVYKPQCDRAFAQANQLQRQGRVQAFGEADYREGAHTAMWITNAVDEIAQKIVQERKLALEARLGRPPRHF